jgi:trehalose 6-phosphate synthase
VLERRPAWRGRVGFLACLVPTRGDVPEYRRYKEETFALIERINRRFGRPDWRPIEVRYENDYPQAIAALSLADVTLVNSRADGMNLVAKEGALVNRRDGVLVLSRRAGAHEELGAGALGIDPDDPEGTVAALIAALEMGPEERRWRAALLRRAAARRDIADWAAEQLEALPASGDPSAERTRPARAGR